MKYLLYYKLDSDFVSDQTAAGGDGTKVVSVVDGVAWTHNAENIYYRYSGEITSVTSYTVTVRYKYITFDSGKTEYISSDDEITVSGYTGKKVKVSLFPKNIEGYKCIEGPKVVFVNDDTTVVTFEYDVDGDNEIIVYYVTSAANQTVALFESASTTARDAKINMACVSFDDGTADILPSNLTSAHTYSTPGRHVVRYRYNKTITRIYFKFADCKEIDKIVLPRGLRYLCSNFCEYCDVHEINIPDTLLSMRQNWLFHNAIKIESITIPDSVTGETGYYNFIGMNNLKRFKIGDSVTGIGVQNVRWCDYLEEIEIGKSLTYIEGGSFSPFFSSRKVKKIISHAMVPPEVDEQCPIFTDQCGSNGILYYPAGSDYSSWLDPTNGPLGKKGWTGEVIDA